MKYTSYPAYEDATDRVFRNGGIKQSDAREIPKRIHTRLKTRRKFEIKMIIYVIMEGDNYDVCILGG